MTRDAEHARRPRVLAIASGGGHWVQLLRLRPAFDGCDVTYVTVSEAYRADVADADFRVINDATRWNKIGLVRMALKIGWILARVRPDVVITTGAAPGFFAIRAGRLLGARTVWLDSIANVERLSLSGERVGPHADLWLTQWPHLAGAPDGGPGVRPTGRRAPAAPVYRGAVL
ncbi:MAG: UDP-N-acetylglucosamine--LPS N-acetylglucosamine transferase [Planctomycetota bacterium]|nr:MAG: UDP-N-acetylglucosamine--LPS N-acetylglucosamine transferase [Planctomycetota bacterium]